MFSSAGVLGALCLLPGGGNTLDPLPAHAAFPSQVTALKSSFCGSRRDGDGDCVKGSAARAGRPLLNSSVVGGSVQLAHLQCLRFPLSAIPLLHLVRRGHAVASCCLSLGAGG